MELEEEKTGGVGEAPRGRAPRRNVRRGPDAGNDDAGDDDDNGERLLRSGAADAARPKEGWTENCRESDGG